MLKSNKEPAEILIQKAISLMEKAQKLDWNKEQNWSKISKLLYEAACIWKNDDIIEHFEDCYHDIINSYVWFNLTCWSHYLNTKDNPEKAIEYFEKTLEFAPDDPITYMDIWTAYAQLEKLPDALKAWRTALKFFDGDNEQHTENIDIVTRNIAQIMWWLDMNKGSNKKKKPWRF